MLLTGEYAVLDGATALALPTKYGQKMTVKNSRGSDLVWISYDHNNEKWFSSHISLYDFSPVDTTDQQVSKKLQKLLKNSVRLNSEFLSKWNGFKVETQLTYPADWGLGSSATLFCLLGEWADINPLELYFKVENGSGYDVACGIAESPIKYVCSDEEVGYTPIEFDPSYSDNLYFVYLGNKQDTQEGIKDYFKKVKKKKDLVAKISEITDAVIEATKLAEFESLMKKHETIIADAMGYTKVQDKHFSDYWGVTKSLGAWGGDFILATSEKSKKETTTYFTEKGFSTVIPYADMIMK